VTSCWSFFGLRIRSGGGSLRKYDRREELSPVTAVREFPDVSWFPSGAPMNMVLSIPRGGGRTRVADE